MTSTFEIRGLKPQDVWDFENGFHWFSEKSRICKLLAQYDIYRSIINLPGSIYEFGVYKGASLIRFGTYRDLIESDFSRKIVGFDSFGSFPTDHLTMHEDIDFISQFEACGGDGLSEAELIKILHQKGLNNIQLVAGNVFDTFPRYLDDNPAEKVALVNIDLDVKEPTDLVLELVFDRLVSGGVIIFDDYGTVKGETVAADNFVGRLGLKLERNISPFSPAFVRKP